MHPRQTEPGARNKAGASFGSEASRYTAARPAFQALSSIGDPPAAARPRFGRARIQPLVGGNYRPSDDGQWAVILEVRDRFDEIVDCVGWLPADPSRWWLRHGDDCPILGAAALAQAAWHGEAVKLYASAEAWLRAQYHHHRDAVCILRGGIDLRPLFDGVSRVDCQTVKLKQRLERQLRAFEPRLWAPAPAEGKRHAA